MRKTWVVVAAVLTALAGATALRGCEGGPPPHGPVRPESPDPGQPPTRRRELTPAPRTAETVAPDGIESGADPATEPARITFGVLVISRLDGTPVRDALVEFPPFGQPSDPRPATARTDAQGWARFDGVPGTNRSLEVRAPGHVHRELAVVSIASEVRVEVDRAVVLRGVVRNAADGAPVEGARVGIWDEQALSASEDNARIGGTLVTGADGRFATDGVPAHRRSVVYATRSGFGSARVVRLPELDETDLELRLGEGGLLVGVVTGPDGALLPGIEVQLRREGDPRPGDRSGRGLDWDDLIEFRTARATTDATGQYRFVGVPVTTRQATWTWLPSALRAGDVSHAEPVRFAQHGELATRDIAFAGPARVTVTVTRGGRIGQGALAVRLQGSGHAYDATQTIAHSETSVVFEDVPGGPYFVSLEPSGAGRSGAPSPETDERSRFIDLEPGSLREVPFDLATGVTLEGRVVDAAGAAVANMPVEFSSGDLELMTTVGTLSGPDGTFRLPGLPTTAGTLTADLSSDLRWHFARGPDRPFARTRMENVTPGGGAVLVVVDELAVVRGRFEPRPSGRVRLHVTNVQAGSGTGVEVADDGTFRAPSIQPRLVTRLVFRLDGHAPLVLTGQVFEPGEVRDLGTLRFVRGFTVEGRVVDAQDRPLRGVAVETPEPWLRLHRESATTDAEGRFRVTALPDRPTRLRFAGPPELAHADVVVQDPEHAAPLLVRLTPGAIVRGVLVDASGEPVVDESIFLFDATHDGVDPDDDSRRWQKTNGRGRFGYRVPAGEYLLRVNTDGWRTVAEVRVSEGEDGEFEVRLE